MANPKIPPEIAKKIAAMGKAAPAKPAAPPAAPRMPAPGPAATGSFPAAGDGGGALKTVALLGWLLALIAGGVAVGEYYVFGTRHEAAMAEQAAAYEAKLQELQATTAALVKKVQDDAAASAVIMQTELDFQRMPELPLETTFRANQVLYIESRLDEPFTCKVRLFRPSSGASREVDFSIKSRTYQDLGAMGDWVFARGDKVEFVKPGYKPRALVVP